jgi:hypothetical protein
LLFFASTLPDQADVGGDGDERNALTSAATQMSQNAILDLVHLSKYNTYKYSGRKISLKLQIAKSANKDLHYPSFWQLEFYNPVHSDFWLINN